jgi:hypothetical protein
MSVLISHKKKKLENREKSVMSHSLKLNEVCRSKTDLTRLKLINHNIINNLDLTLAKLNFKKVLKYEDPKSNPTRPRSTRNNLKFETTRY